MAASLTVGDLAAPRKFRRDEAGGLASRKMNAAALIAASLTAGELAAPLKSRRDEAAAAAQEAGTQTSAVAAAATAAAGIRLSIFATPIPQTLRAPTSARCSARCTWKA